MAFARYRGHVPGLPCGGLAFVLKPVFRRSVVRGRIAPKSGTEVRAAALSAEMRHGI
jgi:hypothetical protein